MRRQASGKPRISVLLSPMEAVGCNVAITEINASLTARGRYQSHFCAALLQGFCMPIVCRGRETFSNIFMSMRWNGLY